MAIKRWHNRSFSLTGHSRWYYLFKGILLSFAITVPVFFILSVAMAFTAFPEEFLPPAVLITIVASIITASFFATAGAKNSGWFNGTLVGFAYIIVPIIIRWIMERRFYIDRDVITMLMVGLLIGSISGMAGLNLGKRKTK